jgi:mono/diheme cytochrome c family protein
MPSYHFSLEYDPHPIRIVSKRGYLATTAANPRHYGMPPFQQILSNEEIARVVTFIRNESKK